MTTSPASTRESKGTMSPLARLRDLIPLHGQLSFEQALRVAELQAVTLHGLLDVPAGDAATEADLGRLPRLRVVREPLTVSGTSHWNGRKWVICLNATDSLVRQRFTLLHEFAHVIWHGHTTRLFRGNRRNSAAAQAEIAADYFAGCALVPKRQLKAAWGNGLQRPEVLAEHFGVSVQAIQVRLAQTGLDRVSDTTPTPRCARPVMTPRTERQQFRPMTRSYASAHDTTPRRYA